MMEARSTRTTARFRGPVTVAVLGALLSACSLLVSTSGLSGGTEVASSGDASSGDATVQGDTSASVDALNDDGSTRACAAPHTFCSDFDTGMLTDSWELFSTDGSSRLDSTSFVSPTRSLLLQCGSGTSCGIFKRLPSASRARVELQVEAVDLGPVDAASSSMFVVSVDIAGGTSRLLLLQVGGVLFSQICDSTGCPYTSRALGSPSTTRFRRVTVDLRWNDPNPNVDILLDGTSTGVVPFPLQGAGAVRVVVGCEFGASCPDPVAMRVDDVVVDTFP